MSEDNIRRWHPSQDLLFVADTPMIYHCHHFNLFLDQSIDDAVGPQRGFEIKMAASREAATQLLTNICQAQELHTPSERLQMAQQIFAACGHGKLEILWDGVSGEAHGEYLHYGHSWREKYSKQVKRRHPADPFAAGFAAAAAAVAQEQPATSVEGKELACIALRDPRCHFSLGRATPEPARTQIRLENAAEPLPPAYDSLHEDTISEIAAGLKTFVEGVAGDERGLVQAFGVFVTMTPSTYYNRISYDAIHELEAQAPAFANILESLLRESGHVCVFNTFGGILSSPEWEALLGGPPKTPEEVIIHSMAIARGLGFGHWTLQEFIPEKRLVISAPGTYEIPYYGLRHGLTQTPRSYMLQGSGPSLMKLATRVDFSQGPTFTTEVYNQLFRQGVQYKSEETRSPLRGDDRLEVVVSVA